MNTVIVKIQRMLNNQIIYLKTFLHLISLIFYLSSTMSITTTFPETNKINIGMVVSLAGILIYKCKYDKNINV